MDRLRSSCCCPSFIIAFAGPWLCISGAVFVEQVVVHELTDFVWLGLDPHCNNKLIVAAKLFKALKECIASLNAFYQNLELLPTGQASLHRFFPFIRSWTDEDGKAVDFDYVRPLTEQGSKPIFLAKTVDDHREVVVKFVQTYHSKAHHLLASIDMAPKLLYCGAEDPQAFKPGALKMVVMAYVPGLTAFELHEKKLPVKVTDQVKAALDTLHQHNIVFGDLRKPNIMIMEDSRVMLVDFDWCGEHGEGRYPPTLNDADRIDWHPGVERDGIMRIEHDLHMLGGLSVCI
jgi:serine/threonine protein kinase